MFKRGDKVQLIVDYTEFRANLKKGSIGTVTLCNSSNIVWVRFPDDYTQSNDGEYPVRTDLLQLIPVVPTDKTCCISTKQECQHKSKKKVMMIYTSHWLCPDCGETWD